MTIRTNRFLELAQGLRPIDPATGLRPGGFRNPKLEEMLRASGRLAPAPPTNPYDYRGYTREAFPDLDLPDDFDGVSTSVDSLPESVRDSITGGEAQVVSDGVAALRAARERMAASGGVTSVGAEPTGDESRTFGQRVGDLAMGGLRTVGRALEFVVLPQDVMFAGLAGYAHHLHDRKILIDGVEYRADTAFVALGLSRNLDLDIQTPDGRSLTRDEAYEYIDGQQGLASSIWDYMSQVELAKYVPFGDAPERPVSGRDLMEMFGWDYGNESVAQIGGVALDFLADPLLVGSALRVAGRIARGGVLRRGGQVGGGLEEAAVVGQDALYVGDNLIRLGNTVDRAMSIGGVTRALWLQDTPLGRRARDMVEGRLEMAWRGLQDPVGSITGGLFARTAEDGSLVARRGSSWVDDRIRQGVDWLVPTRARARLLFDDPVIRGRAPRATDESGRFIPGEETFGTSMATGERMARQRGDQVIRGITEDAAALVSDVLGDASTGFMERVFGAFRGVPRLFRGADDMPEALRTSMLSNAFDVVDRAGPIQSGARTGIRVLDDDIAALGRMPDAIGADEFRSVYGDALEHVLSVARGAGMDSAEQIADVTAKFKRLVEGFTALDSRLGYELSGYGLIRERFIANMAERAGVTVEDATNLWRNVLQMRILDPAADLSSVRVRVRTPTGVPRDAGRNASRVTVDSQNVTGVRQYKDAGVIGDYLDVDEVFTGVAGIGLGSYIDSLQRGHLRRAYGVWTDNRQFTEWQQAMEAGRLVPNNVLDDVTLAEALVDAPEVLQDFRRYMGALATPGMASRAANPARPVERFTIRQDGMIRHLAEGIYRRGDGAVSQRDAFRQAQEYWERVWAHVQPSMHVEGSPLFEAHQAMREFVQRNANFVERGGAARMGPGGAFQARDPKLDQDYMALLGEFRNPILSLVESSEAARRAIPIQEFMRGVWEDGVKHGAIVPKDRLPKGTEFYVNPSTGVRYRQIPDDDASRRVWGAMAGAWVHPQLQKEVMSAFRTGPIQNQTFQRLRQMVTGGYLASPHIAATNLVGAVYAATVGSMSMNAAPLLAEMGRTAREVFSGESQWYRKMQEYLPVEDLDRVGADIARRDVNRLRLAEAGTGGRGVGAALEHLQDWWEGVLRAPGGLWWAGLDGFQKADQWVRTSVFKYHAERLVAGGMAEGAAFSRAAEYARLSTLDYGDLPRVVEVLRDSGLLLFPGFNTLIVGRNVDAIINRPHTIALWDRIPDAVINSVMDPEERASFMANVPEWMNSEAPMPVGGYVDGENNKRWFAIPFNQLAPSRTLTGEPLVESLTSLGLAGALFDLASAYYTGSGDAPLAGQYGREVFQPHAEGAQRLRQTAGFLYNSFAPAFVRRLWSPTPGVAERDRGLLPELGQAVRSGGASIFPGLIPLSEDLGSGIYSIAERESSQADRGLVGELIASVLRSPQVITTSGPLVRVRREYELARRRHSEWRAGMGDELRVAVRQGRDARAAEIRELIARRDAEFNEEWGPAIEAVREMNLRRQREYGR